MDETVDWPTDLATVAADHGNGTEQREVERPNDVGWCD